MRKIARKILRRFYGFDGWHVGHAGEVYAADIVRYLNAQPEAERGAVVEIGCGLGDILRRLRFRDRLGLDRDTGALAAARFLARLRGARQPRFEAFDFPGDRLTGTYDCVIMVNWIHEIDPAALRGAVHAIHAHHLREGGRIVLDTVEDPAYMYNHDVHALAPPGAAIDHLGAYPRGRHIWAVSRRRFENV